MGGAAASVPSELLILNQPPGVPYVTEHHSMWAYKNHFYCEDALYGATHVSYDSGVACIMNQRCQSSTTDRNPVDASLKFIGVLQNILRVEYAWVRHDVFGSRKILMDEYGFWLVKLGALQEEEVEPYVFPHQVS
jgi:hypothetical protein